MSVRRCCQQPINPWEVCGKLVLRNKFTPSLERAVATLVLAVSASGVAAFDLAVPFSDPLQAMPSVIESGAILPGDEHPLPCPAQKDFSNPLLLIEAVDLALCNSPQVRSAWAAIKVQAAAAGEARAAYLPALSGTTNRLRTETDYTNSVIASSTKTGQTTYGNLTWRLLDFGGREGNRKSANSLLLAAIANHDALLQKTLLAVIQSYFDAQTAKAFFDAKEQNQESAKSTLESAQRKEDRGAISHGDTLQAKTALAKVALEKNRALGNYQKAISILRYALGVQQQTQLSLADDITDKQTADPKDLDTWLAIAERSHPAIIAARAQWESAKLKVTSIRSEGLPTVDLMGNYYKNGYPGQGLSQTPSTVTTFGLSITVPLFDGFSRTYKVRGAEALVEQREADLLSTEQNTLMEVVKAYADTMASMQNLQYSEQLLSSAQESLHISKRRYEKGAADVIEILNTQIALSDAQQERIRSLAEWRSARLRLVASAGMIGRSTLAR